MVQSTTASAHLAAEPQRPASATAVRWRRPSAERRVRALLERADVRVGGDRPWDVAVHDPRFFRAVARRGMTGAGDSYVDGWWDCERIDELFVRAIDVGLPAAVRWAPYTLGTFLRHRLLNLQDPRRARTNAPAHYDRGNPLFKVMLDPRMAYSCAYYAGGARTLEAAQEAKLDLVCRKLGLRPGMRVLDIGCGWGSFVRFAAERYGARCTGITLSAEQAAYARTDCAGLPVEIALRDYREQDGRFDRVVSIGMFEHVGQRNHARYMSVVERVLTDDGLALLHFFASPRSFPNRVDNEVDWFERRIFPGLVIPSLAQVGRAIDGRFVLEDLHDFGADYDPTLMAWLANFDRRWPELAADGRWDDRFRRMWRFYLQGAAGGFRSRKYMVWQLVLSKRGVPGGYAGVR